MNSDRHANLEVILAGAAPDTLNHGVSALMVSVVDGITSRIPRALVSVLDHGSGVRPGVPGSNAGPCGRLIGVRKTRRWYLPESNARVSFSARLGGAGNPGAIAFRNAAAVLDISAGDSFTDLYGPWRFDAVTWSKRLAMKLRKPLVLLPQTYGPFKQAKSRAAAAEIVRACAACWARDARSYELLKDLLGPDFDPERHRLGVDVAFGLLKREPAETDWPDDLRRWVGERGEAPLVGFNVSGLIRNSPDGGKAQFGFRSEYRDAVRAFLQHVTSKSEARVLLVPHVVTPSGHYESDIQACVEAAAEVPEALRSRVRVAPAPKGPGEAKWIISQCDWFCGTRMHATIAALSSGVPTAAIAYSDKTLGVFESCGLGDHVHDPRDLDTKALVERVIHSFDSRREARAILCDRLPGVIEQATKQMDQIAAFCTDSTSVEAAHASSR